MALPVLYENRIKFYSSLFQTFFHTETMFHSDCTEIKSKLDDICENLSKKTAQQTPHPPKENVTENDHVATTSLEESSSPKPSSEFIPDNLPQTFYNINSNSNNNNNNNNNNSDLTSSSDENLNYKLSELEIKNPDMSLHNLKKTASELENVVLFTVRATYAYEAKEADELTFVKDDLIEVVEGTLSEKEELDDGWLIGVHLDTGKRGLFPENFTKKI